MKKNTKNIRNVLIIVSIIIIVVGLGFFYNELYLDNENEFLIPRGAIPGAEAKQEAILQAGIEQAEGKLPEETFFIPVNISQSTRDKIIIETEDKINSLEK